MTVHDANPSNTNGTYESHSPLCLVIEKERILNVFPAKIKIS